MKRSGDDGLPTAKVPRQAQMSSASSTEHLRNADALTYLKSVKEIFQDRMDQYAIFLDIMKEFKAKRIKTEDVTARVKDLFKGHRSLILGFNTFLPNGYRITLPEEDEPPKRKKPVQFEEAMGFVSKIKSRFDTHVYDSFLDILNMYRKEQKSITELYQEVSVLFGDHRDLLVEFTHFLPDTSGTASTHFVQRGRNNNQLGDDRSVCVEKYNNRGWEDADSSDHKRKIARRDDSVSQFHQGMLTAICEKVQKRLQDPEKYQKFLDCVHSFESKFVTAPQFRMLVGTILGEQDLMDECDGFITYVEKTGCTRNSKHLSQPLKIEERDGEHHDREDRNKSRDPSTKERDRYDRGLAVNTKEYSSLIKEKYLMKPIQELDLSNCDSCTPSYRLLPENYPIQLASHRTEIGSKVLNDHWVSVTSGSEDYSFKHMRKNQYEESLFRCEDDRFELDMLLESVNATTLRVEELLNRMNPHTNKIDTTFYIEDHLTALHLRCIERLYGDHGLDVMDVLRRNAPLALPVILTRLKQKQEEWARCRTDFNKVWAEIYAKNYHKSLDHRSFYFKQQDAKNLSLKALLAEIKETSERNQNEDEMILSFAAGHRQPIRPDMEFEYPDPEIQEDLYQLMKFSCEEVCAPEQYDKVMNIWTASLETVLGIHYRCDEVDPSKDFKANGQNEKNVTDIGEGNSSVDNDMSKSGDVDNRSKTEDADNGLKIKNVCYGSDILRNAPRSGEMGNVDVKQVGLIEQGTECAFGETTLINETASETQTGPEGIGCGTEARQGGESQVNVTTKPTPISEVWHEAIKSSQYNNETCTSTNASKNSTKETRGEEMCIDEAEAETDVIADDEGSGSAQGTSDCENVSENGDVSVSESADGEQCSPEEPDEDGAHNKVESEEEADDDIVDDRDGAVMHSPDRSLHKMKPLNMKIPMVLRGKEKGSEIFYGSDSFYILFRLHQMLYDRMRSAKLHSASPENKWRILNDGNSTDSYARFKDALHSLLNGSSDNAKFEDDCRAIIGAQSYVLFTLDKLIQKLIKQLQVMAMEEVDNRLVQLYSYERSRYPENFVDAVYHENARFIVPEDNLYRIQCLHYPARLTMQLMKNEIDKPEVTAVSMDPNFAAYLKDDLLSNVLQRKGKPGIFLMRNKTKLLTGDETADTCKVMEGLKVYNGLEIKISCNTYKAAYVLDTEDFLYRPRRVRKALYGIGSSTAASNGVSNGYLRRRKRKLIFN